MTQYIVITEDGDPAGFFEAIDPVEAADKARREWDLFADPGFKLYVVRPENTTVCELGLTVVASDNQQKTEG